MLFQTISWAILDAISMVIFHCPFGIASNVYVSPSTAINPVEVALVRVISLILNQVTLSENWAVIKIGLTFVGLEREELRITEGAVTSVINERTLSWLEVFQAISVTVILQLL